MPPAEVFVSFAHADHERVEPVIAALRRHGVPCWFAPQQIRASQAWHDEIGLALDRCDWFMLFLTPHATASRWVKRELRYALGESRYDDRIVPIMLEPCQPRALSWVLGGIQHIDATAFSQDDLCRELLPLWGLGFSP